MMLNILWFVFEVLMPTWEFGCQNFGYDFGVLKRMLDQSLPTCIGSGLAEFGNHYWRFLCSQKDWDRSVVSIEVCHLLMCSWPANPVWVGSLYELFYRGNGELI